jgi:hypothetical protein
MTCLVAKAFWTAVSPAAFDRNWEIERFPLTAEKHPKFVEIPHAAPSPLNEARGWDEE